MRHLIPLLVSFVAACGSKQPATPDAEAPAAPAESVPPDAATPAAPPDAAAPAAPPDATLPAPASTYYLGRMSLPQGIPVKMLVTVTGASATLDVPLQHLVAAPLTAVVTDDSTIAFDFLPKGAPAAATNHFKAAKQADGSFDGTVTIGDAHLPIRFTVAAGPEALVAQRPQTPQPPFAYKNEELRVQATPDVALGCTLTLPATPGPYGAVLMLTGSGVQDRDETIFDHKPFLVIADALAKAGVASVRCDDRGAGQSGGDPSAVDADVFVADAEAVLAAVRLRPEIDPLHIGVLGHSEGGMTAAALVKKPDNHIAFVVTMSGPAQTGRQILARQNRDLVLAQGAKAAAADAIEKAVDAYFGAVAAAPSGDDPAVAAAAKSAAEIVNGTIEGEVAPQLSVSALTSTFTALARQKWLKGFVAADPAHDLAHTSVPILALFGEKDTQVRAPENVAALQSAFADVKDADLTIKVIPGANHLYQDATTGAVAEYDEIEQTINPATLGLMVDWIAHHAGAKK